MVKNVFKIIAIFVIGIVGGIFADQILWPYFIERPLFFEYRIEKNPVYLTETKEIYIQENIALQEAVEKVDKVVVGIKAETLAGVSTGSGLIVTSDGLVVTLADLLPKNSKITLFLDGKVITPRILQAKDGLALLKIEEEDLPTVSFADFDLTKLGQRVFLVGVVFDKNNPLKMVNEGIIKYFDEDSLLTNIFEENSLEGSVLFDIEGNILGLNTIDHEGRVSAVPSSVIKEFLGF